MIRSVSIFALLFLPVLFGGLSAQNITIRGHAPAWYRGRVIELWKYADYVTMNRTLEHSDTVGMDGTFELQMYSTFTEPVFLRVENVTSDLYVQPDYVYAITLPPPDESRMLNPDVDVPVNIGVIGADSTELNALVFDFQHLYNAVFIPEDGRYLTRAALFKRTDSLYRIAQSRYRAVERPYFESYITYFIASLNASVSRGERFLVSSFISGKPIQYRHYEYMKFFNACFSGYFRSVSSRYTGQTVFNIINVKADYGALTAYLKREEIMRSDSIRELVCLVNLWEAYFSADFIPDAVQSVVSQLLNDSRIDEHRSIARNMLARMGRLQPGTKAPDFSARSRDGAVASFGALKSRWIYLNFFSTSNSTSLREMSKIADLHRRYGHKVTFVSVCLDDSLSSYKKYLRENPKFAWAIWFNNDRSFTRTAKEHYDVTGTEGYFFISNLGEIVQNPAVTPSAGIEFKFNTIFNIRQRTPRSGLR